MVGVSVIVMLFSGLLLFSALSQDSLGFVTNDKINEWGSFGIGTPGHFSHPQYAAVDIDGNVYVSDLGNKRIQKFTSDGQYVTDWGKSGKASGEFHYPSGIAVSGDSVYVADRDLNRVQKFSLNGTFVLEWGQKGVYDGQFLFPNGIAVHNGTVYVVDTGNQRVQMFTPEGMFLSSFGSSGLSDGQFLTAVGIDVDSDGNVYVADKGNGKIEKFDHDGKFLRSFQFHYSNYAFSPEAIEVDPAGEMFILNSYNNRILHLPQEPYMALGMFDKVGPFPDSFGIITDIEMGANGELIVVDSSNHKIQSVETDYYQKPSVTTKVPTVPELVEITRDQTKPVIVAPESIIVEATDKITSVSIGMANATDDSGIKTIINNSPDGFPPGVTNVVWIAFDNTGYSSSAHQTINVKTCGHDYSEYVLIEGTDGDDLLEGTDGDDLIFGLAGNDMIFGGLGNDCIFAGPGDDDVFAGPGDDTLMGNSGDDLLEGQSGIDIIYSDAGADVLNGGDGNNRCYSHPESANDVQLSCE